MDRIAGSIPAQDNRTFEPASYPLRESRQRLIPFAAVPHSRVREKLRPAWARAILMSKSSWLSVSSISGCAAAARVVRIGPCMTRTEQEQSYRWSPKFSNDRRL